jgi:hypothetical protein
MAVRTLAGYFVDAYRSCTEEERKQLDEILDGAAPFEAGVHGE